MSAAAVIDLDPGRDFLALVRSARASLADADTCGAAGLDEPGLAGAVGELARLRSQVDALELAVTAEVDRRQVADETGATGTPEWVSGITGERQERVGQDLRFAHRLHRRYPLVAAALAAGEIRREQARAIVDGLEISADDATVEQLRAAERSMLDKATGASTRSGVPMTAPKLRRAARRVFRSIDADLHRRHLARSVRASSQRGATSTWLTLHNRGDGTCTGRFAIPEFHGQVLRSVLEQLTAPRRSGAGKDGRQVLDVSAPVDWTALGWADRMGLAWCELIEHLPLDRLSRSIVNVMALIDHEDLLRDPDDQPTAVADDCGDAVEAVGRTTVDVDLTAAEVRRLACEAGIVPAVLGGESVPLDLGRTRRLHSEKQRQAYAAVYEGCAIASCDRPLAWCEIHHPLPWSRGGRTDLANGLPLCWHHHRVAHNPLFRLIRHSDTEWVLQRRRRC